MSYLQTGTDKAGKPVNLFYEDLGAGKPVVLIHGWPSSHEMWEYQTHFLAQNGCRVIAYDRRGFGKSSKPWDGYEYDTFADDLKALLDSLDLNEVTLVGFSMGGGEVARYFGRHAGKRVSKAVLVSSVVPYLLKTSDNPEGVPEAIFEGMIEQIRQDRPGFLAGFGKQFFGVNLLNHPISQAFQDWFQLLALLASPKATMDCVRAFGTTDFRADMAHIKVPTLIIHGDKDMTVPHAPSSDQASKAIAGASYKVYAGSPHGLFYTDRDKLNADLISFIA